MAAHSSERDLVLKDLNTDAANGLSLIEVPRRLALTI